jgi:lipopolysaccharide export system protein LptA
MKHWFLSLLLLLPLPLAAEQPTPVAADKPLPVTIEADRMELNQKLGTSHYQGRVILVQGALQIQAEEITLYSVEKKLQRAVAEGTPATLLQQGDEESGPIRGEATHMEYLPLGREIRLNGQARLWRDGNEFSGEQINYNLDQQLVKASSDTQGDGRVRVLLQPEDDAQPQGATP